MLILPIFYFMVQIVVSCLITGFSRFLLIMFTSLNSQPSSSKVEGEEVSESAFAAIEEMRRIYHMLMALLYFLYYLAAFSLPIILLTKCRIPFSLLASATLICFFGEFVPRMILDQANPLKIVGKCMWIITVSKWVNQCIPLNSALGKLFRH
jgi:hypothetical protein